MNVTRSFADVSIVVHPSSLSSIIETEYNLDWKQIATTKFGPGFTTPLQLTAESYNLADLNSPIPARPYFLAPNPVLTSLRQAGQTFSPSLLTIFEDYSPFVSVGSPLMDVVACFG